MTCYHCDQPLPKNEIFTTEILGEVRQLCCIGCQAVAETIIENGLDDYYRFRTEPALKAEPNQSALPDLDIFNDKSVQESFVIEAGHERQAQLSLQGVSCPACAWLIERQLSKLNGIAQIAVNVGSRRATVSWDASRLELSYIFKAIENIGYRAQPFQPDQHEKLYVQQNKRLLIRLGIAGLMSMQVMMLTFGIYFGVFGDLEPVTLSYFQWTSLLLSLPVVFYSGREFYVSAFRVIKVRAVNMDVPISLAIIGLFAASLISTVQKSGETYFESVCMFIFLLLVSRYLEHRSRHKSAQISANSVSHTPIIATVIDKGEQQTLLANKLTIGQHVLVKVGETVPIDGVIIDGCSNIDESMLSGEFLPVTKNRGDKVFGGTINQSNPIEVEVQSLFKDALIQNILRMQELAFAQKPEIALLVDKFSQYFVTAVLSISAITFITWQWVDPSQAFWVMASVLVATCPCALGLATPSALTCAIALLNRQGILVKRANVLEQLKTITHACFDKTGTLTEGKFTLAQYQCIKSGLCTEDVLNIAATLESVSEHPISHAFPTDKPLLTLTNNKIDVGLGVSGTINNTRYKIGAARYFDIPTPNELEHCNVFLGTNNEIIAGFVVRDKTRTDAQGALNKLQSKSLTILSGDNEAAVAKLASELSIEHWQSECSPEQKMHYVQGIQNNGGSVLMVGDGVNDSPVMAATDVSVALANATDIAKNSADVVMLNQNITGIIALLDISKECYKTIKQNLWWAVGYNTIVLPLAVTGLLSPWMGVIGMSLSSLLVVANSTRLLNSKAAHQA
jgi:Cu2+-exporting ATPase